MMKSQLIDAGLWKEDDTGDPEEDITAAWKVLARLPSSGRALGRAPNGQYEFAIIHPESGCVLTSAHGATLPMSICKAALIAASLHTDSSTAH